MSIESWKKEYYPEDAAKVSKKKAIAHSLRKWRGLTKENLKKHSCYTHLQFVIDSDGDEFPIDSETCALCHHYYHYLGWDSGVRSECKSCPLAKYLGRRCDEYGSSKNERPPYFEFLNGNPSGMIRALEAIEKIHSNKK